MIVVTSHWNNSSSTFNLTAELAASLSDQIAEMPLSIPEPASLALFLMAAPLLLRRSSRH
jgi:hypothetical protein